MFPWIGRYIIEFLFTLPALIAAFLGRRYLKSVVLGNLSTVAMIGIGVGTGCACILFSSIIGLSYFIWPGFHWQGLSSTSGGLPITAYVFGPLGEEMFYQVGLQTWLQRFGPILAVLGATAVFWGSHLYGGFVPMHDALLLLLPSMLAFALVRQTTKSFGAAVLAHSTYNALVSCLILVPR